MTIFDAGKEHDLAHITMGFLSGQDPMIQARAGQLLSVATVLQIGIQVAQTLACAHRHQVVHREIKPGNIMFVAATAAVKVTDFGIARITDTGRTKTGTILDTLSFVSPEQLAGHPVDGRSDLYSLGVTLFQLLTGALPFRGDSLGALMFDVANHTRLGTARFAPSRPKPWQIYLRRGEQSAGRSLCEG
ncbi:MAG: serine/threonine-protein kinase [Hydrogenophaga sp.]